jgi:hypothetical protein
MWKPALPVALLIVASFLGNRAMPQGRSKKEQSAKPLTGYSVLVVEQFEVEPVAVQAGFDEAQVPVNCRLTPICSRTQLTRNLWSKQ